MTEADVLVLGAGLAGLSTAAQLGPRATLLERAHEPGGLVRSLSIDGWWFDHVIHLLHFQDEVTKARIFKLLGDVLAPLSPEAYVMTSAGVVRYPVQENLGELGDETAAACVAELEGAPRTPPANYRELLLHTFGKSLCELFFFPYNTKMWRRDLAGLAPSGFVWNIARPNLRSVVKGASRPAGRVNSYNRDGWYPRPPMGSPVRGMEVLTRALAAKVHDLRVCHEVVAIRAASRTVSVRNQQGAAAFRWRQRCVSTLPLPWLVSLCEDVPRDLARAAQELEYNRVLSVAIRVLGPRPNVGLWHYYPSASVLFTRLVFLHAFDPLMAPPEGWPLLAEVPWRTDEPLPAALEEQVVAQARAVGALGPEHRVLDVTVLQANPAYVVFRPDSSMIIEAIVSWLRSHGIDPVGRFGRWEYSSMAQVLRDGHSLASSLDVTTASVA